MSGKTYPRTVLEEYPVGLRHSPTPWTFKSDKIRAADGKLVAQIWTRPAPKDQAFLLTAVNAHDDLVQVLRDVEWNGQEEDGEKGYVAACPRCGAHKSDGKHFDYCQLSAAIAKAEARA